MNNQQDPIEPRKVPVQERSRRRFETILEVALELIIKHGVDTVPMSDIAQGAEISIASLYQYFPDKASIVATLANRFNQEGQQCVKKCFSSATQAEDLHQAFHQMIDEYYDFFESVPGSYALWQASQSDRRLYELDKKDMEEHAKTVGDCLTCVLTLEKQDALRHARILVGIVASSVRCATNFPKKEGLKMIEICKNAVLTPSLQAIVEKYHD